MRMSGIKWPGRRVGIARQKEVWEVRENVLAEERANSCDEKGLVCWRKRPGSSPSCTW